MYAWNWIRSINNVPTPRESCSVTSEVASCAVKDDTEVEVVTHSLSSLPSGTCFFPRSDTALHNNVKKKKKKIAHAYVCMQTRKPCNNQGKKKPTINSTITAAITPSVEPPLFTSHLITDEPWLGCSQKFMN